MSGSRASWSRFVRSPGRLPGRQGPLDDRRLSAGVATIGEPWREAVVRQFEPLPMETMRPAPPVRLAALGEDVVPIGAALVALQAATGDNGGSAARVREPLQEP